MILSTHTHTLLLHEKLTSGYFKPPLAYILQARLTILGSPCT